METPTATCPCCGARSLLPGDRTLALLAVCDVLVVKALETMGKWIVRQERSRHRALGSQPMHTAHTIWQPDDTIVSKALRSAWDVVPPLLDSHGCCDLTSRQLTSMLDEYVHDLVITGTRHSLDELEYRFDSRLGLRLAGRMVDHG